jgi:hypothetical protein
MTSPQSLSGPLERSADKAQILVKIGAKMVNNACAGRALHDRNGAVQNAK